MPLGILNDDVLNTKSLEFTLNPRDKMIVYTDGILEASNDLGELFGRERFEAALQPSQCDIDKVRKGLYRFTGNKQGSSCVQDDDISLVRISAGPVKFGSEKGCRHNKAAYDINRAPVPWRITMDLTSDELKLGSPANQLADMIGEATGLYSHKPILSLIISELYNNALDHGVLRLDSRIKHDPEGWTAYYAEREKRLASDCLGHIHIDIEHQVLKQGGELSIKVLDSGAGFDSDAATQGGVDKDGGRGLSLVKQLSESITFTENGRCINVVYAYH